MSDHAEKTHLASGIVFAVVLSALIFLLLGALAGGTEKALIALPFLLLASLYGIFALGAPKGDDAHHAAH